jgi:protein-disulfide isomerase
MVLFGRQEAPVAIDLYTSLACSDCKSFHEQVFGVLVNDYARPGKICLVSREYFQPDRLVAWEAAKAATAAARIGKYEQVADALFSSQEIWTANGKLWETVSSVLTAEQQAAVQGFAKDLGVIADVNKDLEQAKTAGIRGTPIMHIRNGLKSTPFVGVPEVKMFRRFLDGVLGG